MEQRKDISTLTQDVKSLIETCNLKDCTSNTLKYVEKLHNAVRAFVDQADTDSRVPVLKDVVQFLFTILTQGQYEAKIKRRLIKILTDIEKGHPDVVRDGFLALTPLCNVQKSRMKSTLNLYSQLLEVSQVVRSVIREQLADYLHVLSSGIGGYIQQETIWIEHTQDEFLTYCKIAVQLMQHCAEEIRKVTWSKQETKSNVHNQLTNLLQSLLIVLREGSFPKEGRLLSGTCFGYLVMLSTDESETQRSLCSVSRELGDDSQMSVQLGELDLRLRAREGAGSCSFTGNGKLFLINGCLNCASENLLTLNVSQPVFGEQAISTNIFSFLESCFSPIAKFCQEKQHKYLAFKTLQLWYQKLIKSLHLFKNDLDLSQNSHVILETLHLVWTHCDSPVSGVSESVMDIFQLLFDAHFKIADMTSSDLVVDVMRDVMVMSWQVKAKYTLCALLLVYVDIEQWLSAHPDVSAQLLQSMETHSMTPAATHLYKAIFDQIRHLGKDKRTDDILLWLVRGLTSKNCSICYNVCHFWLPWTLETDNKTYTRLVTLLESSGNVEKLLRAQIALYRAARNLRIVNFTDLNLGVILQAVLHANDDLRLDGLALVCNSPRKSDSLSEDEIAILRTALPYSMNSDSAPFRQQFQAHLRVAVSRMRDGALTQIRDMSGKTHHKVKAKQKKQGGGGETEALSQVEIEQRLDMQIDFVDWLWRLCVQNMHPGASYQRLKTCLEWMWVILDSTVYQAERLHKKGGCPEYAVQVMKYANAKGKLHFFSVEACHSLLACILNGTDEIREYSCRVLEQFFPWPLPLTEEQQNDTHSHEKNPNIDKSPDEKVALGLLHKALALCACPRVNDADSGALLCKLIFTKYVIENQWHFKLDNLNPDNIALVKDSSTNDKRSMDFLEILVQHLEKGLEMAKDNTLKAAKKNPSHGFIAAIKYCLMTSSASNLDHAALRSLVKRCLIVTSQLIDLAIQVLGGKVHEEDSAPSFEQMGVAIQKVIEESGCNHDDENTELQENTALSVSHQMLMTWAWLNIRGSSIFFGTLAQQFQHNQDPTQVLSHEQISELGEIFYKILTKSRHRGAIEGCNVGFTTFCTTLLNSPYKDNHAIPCHILDKVMAEIEGQGSGSASSITRRSAGLPLIVQSVLASEYRTKQSQLLHKAVTKLLDITEQQVPLDPDQRLDLPQVHALNILKAVFREASVAETMMNYIERACIVAIEGFASPVWALRNSATQLFSTLLNRMLGQKKTRDDSINSTTAIELFSRFPGLCEHLLTHLQQATTHNAPGAMLLHPSSFPALSILARLSAGVNTESKNVLKGFLEPVLSMAGSAIYGVRKLAAKALVALIPRSDVTEMLVTLLERLPVERAQCYSFNALHGTLLQIESLLNVHTISAGDLEKISLNMDENSWLGNSSLNPCGLILTKYLQIRDKISTIRRELLELEANALLSGLENDSDVQIGHAFYISSLIPMWLNHSDNVEEFCSKLRQCISCEDHEIMFACLKCLKEKASYDSFSTEQLYVIENQLFKRLQDASLHSKLRSEILQSLIDLYCSNNYAIHPKENKGCDNFKGDATAEIKNQDLIGTLTGLILEHPECESAALAVTVVSMLYAKSGQFSNRLSDWAEIIRRGSSAEQSERMRYNTALALELSGEHILVTVLDTDELVTHRELMALSIFRSCAELLMDDHSETRKAAARFVCKLPWIPRGSIPTPDIHPNYALMLLFSHVIGEICGGSPRGRQELMTWIHVPGSVAHVMQQESSDELEELFDTQELNPYRESVVLNSYVVDKLSLATAFVSRTEAEVLFSDLEEVMVILEKTKDGVVLNLTCNGRCYVALQSLMCKIKVLNTSGSRDILTRFGKLIVKIRGHPGLRKVNIT